MKNHKIICKKCDSVELVFANFYSHCLLALQVRISLYGFTHLVAHTLCLALCFWYNSKAFLCGYVVYENFLLVDSIFVNFNINLLAKYSLLYNCSYENDMKKFYFTNTESARSQFLEIFFYGLRLLCFLFPKVIKSSWKNDKQGIIPFCKSLCN